MNHVAGVAHRRFPLFLVGALTLASFGPYLIGSIRTEQLAVYSSAAVLLPFMFVRMRPYVPLLATWALLLFVPLLGLIPPSAHTIVYGKGSLLSNIDNLALPVVIMCVLWAVVPPEIAKHTLRVAATIVAFGAAANGVLSIVGTTTDISPYLRAFWSGEAGQTTAERAAELGRLSGIFNQPAEAGVVYGLAGLLTVWRFQRTPKTMLFLLTLISIGGTLCVSKVFILGGIPFILVYLWLSRSGSGKLGILFSVVLLSFGVAQTGIFQQWTGFNYLARLFTPAQNQGVIEFYSAGRWNEGAHMSSVFETIMDTRPLTGFGISGLQVAYDSAWTEAMVLGGLTALVLMSAVFVSLLRMARRISDSGMKTLATFVVLFLIGASLGIPALTANRAATIVWVVLSILCLAAKDVHETASKHDKSCYGEPSIGGFPGTATTSPRVTT